MVAKADRSRLKEGSLWERRAMDLYNQYPGQNPYEQGPWTDEWGTYGTKGAVYAENPFYTEQEANKPPPAEYTASEYYGEDPMDALVFDQLSGSAMEGQKANPWAVQSQWDALAGLRDITAQGGLTAIDRARMAEARAQEDAYLRGQRESTIANMNARGMGGSGQELLAGMMGQQGAGQRMAMADLGTEAMALERRDQALRDAFGMGTDLRGQQWDEQAQVNAAKDEIAKTNWAASNVAKTTNWDAERQRRQREAEGRTAHSATEAGRKTDYSVWGHEEPYRRHLERFGITTGGQGIQSSATNSNANWMNAGTARTQADQPDIGGKVLDAFGRVFGGGG